MNPQDQDVRIKAMLWLKEQNLIYGEVIPRDVLIRGFSYQGQTITLIGARGIWYPKGFTMPISITTSYNSPYKDKSSDENSLVEYKYEGNDPELWTNVGLRKAMLEKVPIIYFKALKPGKYFAIFPVFIVEDNPRTLSFTVEIDPVFVIEGQPSESSQQGISQDMRRYVTSLTQQRLHQTAFRQDVLDAYDNSCTICRLHHPELLDAAHIIPDGEPDGQPVVNNGLSLCKIHHAAYDQNILGISPDYTVNIREDILEERDGPMLHYGLQEMNGAKIILPGQKRDYPDQERLARRWERFRLAG